MTDEQKHTPLQYSKWRDSGCPCGLSSCEHYEFGDPEAQCCYGEDGAGDPANFKITTAFDWLVAELLVEWRTQERKIL